jgi:hypothetical protein
LVQRPSIARGFRRRHRHGPPPWDTRGRGPEAESGRERPAHPANGPRLRASLPAPQRRRVDQPQPRRHPSGSDAPTASATTASI